MVGGRVAGPVHEVVDGLGRALSRVLGLGQTGRSG
jgi:hypothetical protein